MLTQKKYNEKLKLKTKGADRSNWRGFRDLKSIPKDISDVKEVRRLKRIKF